MKQQIIKKQRKGRKLPKVRSNYFKPVKGSKKSYIRRLVRGNSEMPNSTKIGAGVVVARRNLPMSALHKRNHRTNEMIGYKI